MFRNYLKTALRNLRKYRGYSFINIVGLATGMASCLVILLYVLDELSFDNYHDNSDRTYRVVLEKFEADGLRSRTWAPISPGYGPRLQAEFPAIEKAARFWPWEFGVFSHDENKFSEDNFVFAEAAVFDIFTFNVISGDPSTSLRDPNTVVLTESIAQKYFGEQDPIGQTLRFQNRETDLQVTGVIADLPKNSHFRFDFLISFATWEAFAGPENLTFMGGDFNYPTYLLLQQDANVNELLAQFPDFLDRNLTGTDVRQPRDIFKIHLQPLGKIYLHSSYDSDYATTGNITYVYIFSAIAVLILLIACVNFINLSTARSIRRAREVGMRKVLGAHRTQLIRQFLGESAYFAVLSLFLAIGLVELVLPAFNEFTGKALALNFASNPALIAGLLSLILFVGCAAGSYPALVLSGFRPVRILKGGDFRTDGKRSSLRSALVVFQFAVSIALLVGVGVVQNQLNYVRNKNLGFNKEQIVTLPATQRMFDNWQSFKHQLIQHPGIVSVTASSRVPSGFLNDALSAQTFHGGQTTPVGFRLPFVGVDHDFFDTYGMSLVAGRNFSRQLSSDSTEAFILNESAARELGWASSQDAIGQRLQYGNFSGSVIGVVGDFHFESMHQKIKPMLFNITPFFKRQISIRLAPGNVDAALDFLRQKWEIYRPDYPFTYFFVDQRFEQRYQSEDRLKKLFTVFSVLSALVACLGLFGLATFTAEQRTKEIGIRKVLGASATKVLLLLSKEYVRLALVANLFAWPVAYYFMSKWLQGFAYQTNLSLGIFAGASVLALVFALGTVGYQSLKAAMTNPSEVLRSE